MFKNKVYLLLGSMFVAIGHQISTGLLSSYYQSEGRSESSNWALLLMLLGVVISALICNVVLKKRSPKLLNIASALSLCLFSFFAAFSNETLLYIASFVSGLGLGFYVTSHGVYLNIITNHKDRSFYIGLVIAAHTFGISIGFYLISSVFKEFSLQAVFLLLMSLILVGVFLLLKMDDIKDHSVHKAEAKLDFSFGKLLPFVFLISLVGFTIGLGLTLIPATISKNLGKDVWSHMSSIMTAVFFFASFIVGQLGHRFGLSLGLVASALFFSIGHYLFWTAPEGAYVNYLLSQIFITLGQAFFWGLVLQTTNVLFPSNPNWYLGPRIALLNLISIMAIVVCAFLSVKLCVMFCVLFSALGILGAIITAYNVIRVRELKEIVRRNERIGSSRINAASVSCRIKSLAISKS